MTLEGHTESVTKLLWHTSEPILYSASVDGTVKVNLIPISQKVFCKMRIKIILFIFSYSCRCGILELVNVFET
jgi:WD40 repeat protein